MIPRHLVLLALAAAAACAPATRRALPAPVAPWQAPDAADASAIRAIFDTTAAGWNRGDLAAYLSAYADSVSGNGATGFDMTKQDIERTMRAGFWRSGRPTQSLRYEDLRIRMLGRDHALVNGTFVLSGAGRPERKGLFTTVWARTSAGWRMIADHSG